MRGKLNSFPNQGFTIQVAAAAAAQISRQVCVKTYWMRAGRLLLGRLIDPSMQIQFSSYLFLLDSFRLATLISSRLCSYCLRSSFAMSASTFLGSLVTFPSSLSPTDALSPVSRNLKSVIIEIFLKKG